MKLSEGLRKGLAIKEKIGRPYCAAVIVAAGTSSRMGGTNKILTVLENLPVICRTVDVFDKCAMIDEIIVVTQQELLEKGDGLHVASNPTVPLPKKPVRNQNGILVEGLDNCLVKFAKCCTPVPGDPVVGFITRGYGISVHRQDCPNASPERRAKEKDRWISVSWGDTHQDAYQTSLDITAKDRQNLFLDVAAALSSAQVRVDSLSAKGTPDGFAVITAQLQVHSKDEINAVMRKLNGVNGVMTVNRAKG